MLQRDVFTLKTRKTTRRLTPERLPTNKAMAVAAHIMLAGQRVMDMVAVLLGTGEMALEVVILALQIPVALRETDKIIPQRGAALVAAASALMVMVGACLTLATNTEQRTLNLTQVATRVLALTGTITVVVAVLAVRAVIGAKTSLLVGATLKARTTLHLAGCTAAVVAALRRAPKQGAEAVTAASE
tara:strand:- start:243 stop:803 length:561 start_codon:yes stop_codon:yes gene_type:complete